jgi:hypothetical protein
MQMSNKKCATVMAAALMIALAGGLSFAATDANAPKSAWDQLSDSFHNPAPWLQQGGDFRFRVETGENWYTLNEDNRKVSGAYGKSDHLWLYERYRTRWWTKSTLSDDVTLNTRLAWETRTWSEPSDKVWRADISSLSARNYSIEEWNPDEVLFDWLNVNVRNIGDMPLTATLGRQDLMGFGAGWLIMDGTPLDGSRTFYFDAARFTYGDKDSDNILDLIYIDQSAKSDTWLKPINDQGRALAMQDEQAGIAYLTSKILKPIQLEGYAIYKNDDPIHQDSTDAAKGESPVTNIPAVAAAPAYQNWSTNAEVYTFGGAVSNIVGPEDHWKYRAEGAYQTGQRDDAARTSHDIEAFGALTSLEYLFRDSLENAVHVGYEYDSGDKPGTDKNEQFDLLWGKWPRWSELMIFTYNNETDLGNETNLHRINLGHKIQLTKACSLSTDYNALFADHTGTPWRPSTSEPTIHISGDSKYRGSLIGSTVRYAFSKQLTGYLLGEYFVPGNYYQEPSDDNAYFIRLNIEYTF